MKKKVTYNSEIRYITDSRLRNDEVMYKLDGEEWVSESETAHWLFGWFYEFFEYSKRAAIFILVVGGILTSIFLFLFFLASIAKSLVL